MDYFLSLFETWGYFIVFLGSVIEGESIIIPACIFAYNGYLSIYKIMIIAFCGTLFADQSLYYVGRYYGQSFINRFPRFIKPANRAFKLLHQWDYKFILSFRFIYGIRFISPIVVGAAKYPPGRYAVLNFIAALSWTIISCSLGYFLGSVIEVIGYALVEKYLLGFSLCLLAIILTLGYVGWKKLHHHEEQENQEEIFLDPAIQDSHPPHIQKKDTPPCNNEKPSA